MQPMYRGYGTPERTGSFSLPTNCGAGAITTDPCEAGQLLARIEPSRTGSSRSDLLRRSLGVVDLRRPTFGRDRGVVLGRASAVSPVLPTVKFGRIWWAILDSNQ